MIKKNTKIVFQDGKEENLVGGIPLSKGDVIHLHREGRSTDYVVSDKIVDILSKGEDKTVNITYILKKK